MRQCTYNSYKMINKITYQNMLTQPHNIHYPNQNMQSNITDEQLLDEDITIVPNTLSPGTFRIRSLSMRIADAVKHNKSNHVHNAHHTTNITLD